MTSPKDPDLAAVQGGSPVRSHPPPGVLDRAGRTLGDEEIAALERVVRSGVLWRVDGHETPLLEEEFAAMYGVRQAVATSSGTAALHLAIAAVDPEPGDEVITTPLTDFGTIIPILAQNAVPVFADVDPRTGNLDPASVESLVSDRTRAIVAVHLFGAAAPVQELVLIARRHGLMLIEDCAQAYLARPAIGDRYVGTYGDIGCFSLQQSKHITCGDGGLVICDDHDLARAMRLFADKGWPRDSGIRTHLHLGLNYRITELQAAVARAQLPKLDSVVERRRAVARRVIHQARLPGLEWPALPERHAFWLLPLVVDPVTTGADNRTWADALTAEGVPTSAGYIAEPVYRYPVLSERRTYGRSGFPLTVPPARADALAPPDCPVAERLVGSTLITVGCNEGWSDADADDVAGAITKVHRWFSSR